MCATADLSQVLVIASGPDAPGLAAALAAVVDDNQVAILDVEQVAIRGHFLFTMVLAVPSIHARGAPVFKDLLLLAQQLGIQLDFRVLPKLAGKSERGAPRGQLAVTVMGDSLCGGALRVVAEALRDQDANIDSMRRLSGDGLHSLELLVSQRRDAPQTPNELRSVILARVAARGIDVAVQPEGLRRRTKRLLAMDMDSTLIQVEVIDELARLHGVADAVADMTRRAMEGELSFRESLETRVALLAGLSAESLATLAARLPLSEGAETLLRVCRLLGLKTALISGGFRFAADHLKARLSLDYALANTLEVRDGVLTGKVLPPIVGPEEKAQHLRAIANADGIPLSQTVAIGDGANDLAMLRTAGLGIAYHAKAKLRAAADTTVTAGGLDRILYLLGLSADETEEAMRAHAD